MIPIQIYRNFPKERINVLGEGYYTRPNVPYRSIIIHTTNGNAGSLFENEARYLQTSKQVGAHYLVGKRGQIEYIVPLKYKAYHTGQTRHISMRNEYAIGIEVHFTPKEIEWTAEQWYALTWLVRQMPSIPLYTHRYVAVPLGRKIDPSGVTNMAFDFWKNNIHQNWKIIETIVHANYRERPIIARNIIKVLDPHKRFMAYRVTGSSVNGNNSWYATLDGYIHETVVRVLR